MLTAHKYLTKAVLTTFMNFFSFPTNQRSQVIHYSEFHSFSSITRVFCLERMLKQDKRQELHVLTVSPFFMHLNDIFF